VDGEWWRGWILVLYIWYIIRSFVNTTTYHTQHNKKQHKIKSRLLKKRKNRLEWLKNWNLCV
jgi:hypothetical protein